MNRELSGLSPVILSCFLLGTKAVAGDTYSISVWSLENAQPPSCAWEQLCRHVGADLAQGGPGLAAEQELRGTFFDPLCPVFCGTYVFLKGLCTVIQKRMGEDADPVLDSSPELVLRHYGLHFAKLVAFT